MAAERKAQRQDELEAPARTSYVSPYIALPPHNIGEAVPGARVMGSTEFLYAMSVGRRLARQRAPGQTSPRVFERPESPAHKAELQATDGALEAPWRQQVPLLAGGMRRTVSDATLELLRPQAGKDGARARRVGTLFKLADFMVRKGVLEAPVEGMETQHRLQKCAYIAQQMGAGLDYKFRFLESGAFSTGLAVDIYQRGAARGGTEPFGGDCEREEVFLRLVRGRSDGWLRIATFAVCPSGVPADRDGFVDHVTWHDPGLDHRLVASVFDEVRALAGPVGGGSQP